MSIHGRGEREYQEALRREFIREVARICRRYEDGEEEEDDAFVEIYDLMYGYGYIE
jgi:hypothetical protein